MCLPVPQKPISKLSPVAVTMVTSNARLLPVSTVSLHVELMSRSAITHATRSFKVSPCICSVRGFLIIVPASYVDRPTPAVVPPPLLTQRGSRLPCSSPSTMRCTLIAAPNSRYVDHYCCIKGSKS